MQAPTEHDLKLIGETTEKIREILDKAPTQLIVGFIRIQNELNFQIIDGNNVSTNFSLEDGKLAIDSINHHPFTTDRRAERRFQGCSLVLQPDRKDYCLLESSIKVLFFPKHY